MNIKTSPKSHISSLNLQPKKIIHYLLKPTPNTKGNHLTTMNTKLEMEHTFKSSWLWLRRTKCLQKGVKIMEVWWLVLEALCDPFSEHVEGGRERENAVRERERARVENTSRISILVWVPYPGRRLVGNPDGILATFSYSDLWFV